MFSVGLLVFANDPSGFQGVTCALKDEVNGFLAIDSHVTVPTGSQMNLIGITSFSVPTKVTLDCSSFLGGNANGGLVAVRIDQLGVIGGTGAGQPIGGGGGSGGPPQHTN